MIAHVGFDAQSPLRPCRLSTTTAVLRRFVTADVAFDAQSPPSPAFNDCHRSRALRDCPTWGFESPYVIWASFRRLAASAPHQVVSGRNVMRNVVAHAGFGEHASPRDPNRWTPSVAAGREAGENASQPLVST